ncbi:MAG: NAD(P)-dependent oxidoreductase [Pseudohongiellaceae bacterium]
MKIAFFNTKPYDRQFFDNANASHQHDLIYHEAHLKADTVDLLHDEKAVCCFINDDLSDKVIDRLALKQVELIALRSAGFNHVSLGAARRHGMAVVRVPAYSPFAVAEHTAGLLLSLVRRLHRAYNRVRDGDFSINGLMGFDLHGKTVGIIGTGKIGMGPPDGEAPDTSSGFVRLIRQASNRRPSAG